MSERIASSLSVVTVKIAVPFSVSRLPAENAKLI